MVQEVDPQVEKILANPELKKLLMDEGMRNVMAECQRPGALRRYMSHPEWGPKLRILANHGLIQLQASRSGRTEKAL